jgi:hypothetical protein
MMPSFSDLQAASSAAISKERTYWSNLVRLLEEFGTQFVEYLQLPSPTYVLEGRERHYVTFTQKKSIGTISTFDPLDYEKTERSIPFTINVALPDISQGNVREISIDLALSAVDGKPSIHSAEFIGGERIIRYDSVAYRTSMDKIADVLKSKAETL